MKEPNGRNRQAHLEAFYVEVFLELANYGEIEDAEVFFSSKIWIRFSINLLDLNIVLVKGWFQVLLP